MTRASYLSVSLIGLALAVAAFTWARQPVGPRPLGAFNPDRVAALEVGMWEAYYEKQRVRLFALLVTTLREQYGFSWPTATAAAFSLAKAAVTFGDATGDYERTIPDLTRGFARIQAATAAPFEPAQVARAELAWWVARRTPGQDSPESVGDLIAELYAQLYGRPSGDMRDAGRLRARAAALRDAQATKPDWQTIATLLEGSYRSLHDRLNED